LAFTEPNTTSLASTSWRFGVNRQRAAGWRDPGQADYAAQRGALHGLEHQLPDSGRLDHDVGAIAGSGDRAGVYVRA